MAKIQQGHRKDQTMSNDLLLFLLLFVICLGFALCLGLSVDERWCFTLCLKVKLKLMKNAHWTLSTINHDTQDFSLLCSSNDGYVVTG